MHNQMAMFIFETKLYELFVLQNYTFLNLTIADDLPINNFCQKDVP